jgi:hypothetical protein
LNISNYENYGSNLYLAAEDVVFGIILATKKLLRKINDDPNNIANYRKEYLTEIISIAKTFDKAFKKWANNDLAKAYMSGLKHAEKDLIYNNRSISITNKILNGSFLIDNPPPGQPPLSKETLALFKGYEDHTKFYGVFRNAAYHNLDNQPLQILRKAEDIYRQASIMAGEKYFKEADIYTRIKYSQEVMDQLAKEGIRTIIYKNGSKYSIDSYCEMLGRTLAGRCSLQANLNRYFESGFTLVVVSSHFRACNLCTPYEGVTLSIEKHPVYESVDDAETQGLFHPNCLHDVSLWWEGKEVLPPRVDQAEQQLIDEYGYNEAQKISYNAQLRQRQIERNIRNWKRRSEGAMDNNVKNIADRKVKYWQKEQREHLKDNTFLNRNYAREQIGKAH